METLIYVIIAIFILLYIIDKKEPLPPKIDVPIEEGVPKEKKTLSDKEKRQEIKILIKRDCQKGKMK